MLACKLQTGPTAHGTAVLPCRDVGDAYDGEEVSVHHFGWAPEEAARLKAGWPESVSIAEEDGYLTVEEGRLRVRRELCVRELCMSSSWYSSEREQRGRGLGTG